MGRYADWPASVQEQPGTGFGPVCDLCGIGQLRLAQHGSALRFQNYHGTKGDCSVCGQQPLQADSHAVGAVFQRVHRKGECPDPAAALATFMEVLDTTIANVALRYIAGAGG